MKIQLDIDFDMKSLMEKYNIIEMCSKSQESLPHISFTFYNKFGHLSSLICYTLEQIEPTIIAYNSVIDPPKQTKVLESISRDDLSSITDPIDMILTFQIEDRTEEPWIFPIDFSHIEDVLNILYNEYKILQVTNSQGWSLYVYADREDNDKLKVKLLKHNNDYVEYDVEGKEVRIISNKVHQTSICQELLAERDRQDIKHNNNVRYLTPLLWLPILAEEAGEVAKEVTEIVYSGKATNDYRKELIQTAAVCIAMVESIDRHNQKY